MSSAKQPWLKFYPNDWLGDMSLGTCSLAARGLWMEMLCIMHEAEPRGSLVKDGKHLTNRRLAAIARCSEDAIPALLAELEEEGVLSKEGDGTIYSRRMRRDTEKAKEDQSNGKKGGSPRLKQGVNPPVDPPLNGAVIHEDNGWDKAQKPEARDQISDLEKEDSGLRPTENVTPFRRSSQDDDDPKKTLYAEAGAFFAPKNVGGMIAKFLRACQTPAEGLALFRQAKSDMRGPDEVRAYLMEIVHSRERDGGSTLSARDRGDAW